MNNILTQNENNAELQKLFEGRFKPVFEALRGRTRNITELQADILAGDVNIPGAAPYFVKKLIIDFFKELARLKVGRLLVGSRGKATRFLWDVPMLKVAATAAGAGPEAAQSRNGHAPIIPKQTNQGDIVSFQFVLRPGLVISLELPGDLSQTEAERLCKFIQALPLDNQPKH